LTLLLLPAFLFYLLLMNLSPTPSYLVLHPFPSSATRSNFSSSCSVPRNDSDSDSMCRIIDIETRLYSRSLPYSNMSPHAAMLSNSIPVRIFAALLVFAFTLVRAAPFSNVTINLRSFTSHIPSEQNCL
jgi:hypothetical protein